MSFHKLKSCTFINYYLFVYGKREVTRIYIFKCCKYLFWVFFWVRDILRLQKKREKTTAKNKKERKKSTRTRRLKLTEIVKVIILESSPVFGRGTEIERQSVLLFYKNKYKLCVKC